MGTSITKQIEVTTNGIEHLNIPIYKLEDYNKNGYIWLKMKRNTINSLEKWSYVISQLICK
jgi:hypothetical protein